MGDFRSAYFTACNRGKRSVALDLRTERGRDTFLRLIETADVLITNFQPGTMDGWGLSFEQLSERNPQLVFAAGSAFGHLGPDASRTGADLSAQASGGLISGTGADGDDPTPVAVTIADHIASQNLVSGILAALVARGRTGRGQRVDVSLLGSQIWAQASEYTYYLLTGSVPGRSNKGHPMIAGIYGIFPTSDGWIAIVGVVGPQRPVFYEIIGRRELEADPRFATPLLTEEQKAELFPIIGDALRERTTSKWCEAFAAAAIRYAPVRDYAAVAADPQVWENGYLRTIEDDHGAEVQIVGSPITLSEHPAKLGGAVPELGQHTEEVLLELGYSWDDIGALRDAGAF
jgi:crotonobetainyl-CoA:carnitine CoA-transferase CaiB-like acyl-CoA transferase